MASEHCPTPLSCLPRNKCAVTTARRGLTPQQCNPFYSNQAIYYIHCKYIHVTYKAENTRTYHVVDIYTADIYTARHTLHCSDPVCRALHNVQYVYCVGRWWWQSPGEEYQAFVWTCIYCILDKILEIVNTIESRAPFSPCEGPMVLTAAAHLTRTQPSKQSRGGDKRDVVFPGADQRGKLAGSLGRGTAVGRHFITVSVNLYSSSTLQPCKQCLTMMYNTHRRQLIVQ